MPTDRTGWFRLPGIIVVVALLGAVAVGANRYFRNRSSRATSSGAPTSFSPQSASKPAKAASDETNSDDGLVLSEANRKYIWDIEHFALILDVHVFPRIARALQKGDAEQLAAFFSDDFQGRVPPDLETGDSANYPFAEFRSVSRDEQSSQAVARDDFIAYLKTCRELFETEPKAEMRLMRLSPVKREQWDGPWHGTTKIRLAGERPAGQPFELELQGHFTLDSPQADLETRTGWIKTCSLTAARSNTATHFLMHEVAAERGIDRRRFHDNWDNLEADPIVARGGAFVADYDRDGRLDLLITDPRELVLFQGQSSGQFRDATASAGLAGKVKRPGAPAILADFDGDGFDDLIVGSQVFQNNQNAGFDEVTERASLRLPPDAGGFAVADYDLDGRVDLYVVRASPGPAGQSRVSWVDDQSGPGNQLWRNMGAWQFRNVTASTNAAAGHRSCFSAVWLDANNDGRPDLAVADEFGSSVLLENRPDGRFSERLLKEPFAGFCMGIAAGDFDNDSRPDIYLANMFSKAGDRIVANLPENAYRADVQAKIKQFVVGSELLRNQGDGKFEPLGRAMGVNGVGWAYGPAMVDFNNDGWLDIYATAGFLSYTRGEPDG